MSLKMIYSYVQKYLRGQEGKKNLLRDVFKKLSELSFKDNPLESVYFSHLNKDGPRATDLI